MYRVCLINMPFASVLSPSIALTQLRAVTEQQLAGRVAIDIAYLTHDFGQYLGFDAYNFVSNSMPALYAGFGDWFFRGVAFPELPDNTDGYMRRFFPGKGGDSDKAAKLIAHKRPRLEEYLDVLIGRYSLDSADLVGFTSMFMQNAANFAMARKLKQLNPDIVTVMGGANCEFPMGQVIANRIADIDYVFSGAALKSFPQFIERLLDGDRSAGAIKGVLSRGTAPREMQFTPGEELSIDVPIALDYAGFLQRFENYFPNVQAKPVLPIETSRGCWWGQRAHCTFCGLNGATMAYRAMKPALALEQFKTLFEFSARVDVIEAVDNILPKEYLGEVLPQLDTPANMRIFYEVKADLSPNDMAVLAKANVRLIQPGIEALATSTLKLMKKGTSAPQNVTFLKNCATFGIKPYWNLLVGFPGETAEVYRRYAEVLPRLVHLSPPTGVYPVRFDRFSPYHKEADAYGLQLQPMDSYGFVYPFDAEDMTEFAYYFSDRNWQADYVQAVAEWLQPLRELVVRWQERWRAAQGAPPVLRFNDTFDMVIDSRGGAEITHVIGPAAAAMLKHAAKATRVDQLREMFTPLYGADVDTALAWLDQAGLVFCEGDRIVSLIIEPGELVAATTGVPDPVVVKTTDRSPTSLPLIAAKH